MDNDAIEKDSDELYVVGKEYLDNGDLDKAIKFFTACVTLKGNYKAYVDRARAHIICEKFVLYF